MPQTRCSERTHPTCLLHSKAKNKGWIPIESSPCMLFAATSVSVAVIVSTIAVTIPTVRAITWHVPGASHVLHMDIHA